MSIKTQYSRISHHTTTDGSNFTVPSSEDFTDGTWTASDLALSEIGVKEDTDQVFIRIDDEIFEFALGGGSAPVFSTVTVTTLTYNAVDSIAVYFIDCSSNNVTITLSAPTDGLKYTFKRIDDGSSGNTATIDGGIYNVDGSIATTNLLSYEAINTIGDGTAWWIT